MSITLSMYGSLLLSLVVGTIFPMVVAAVTKQNAHPAVKAISLLALNAVYGLLAGWVSADHAHAAFDLKAAAMTAAITFGMSVIHHFGWLKAFSITGSGGVIQVRLPGGLG